MEPSRYLIRRAEYRSDAPIETEATPIMPGLGEPLIDLASVWKLIRKHARVIIGVIVAGIAVAFVHVENETPIYTAETTIMISPTAAEGSNMLESLVEIEAAAANSDQYYKTQCAVLQGRNVAIQVIRALDLEHDPVFAKKQTPGLFARLMPHRPLLKHIPLNDNSLGGDSIDEDVPSALVHEYLDDLQVTPVKDTNLVKISFSSPDPVLSARLANAHIAAYGREQVTSHERKTEKTQDFLRNKLVEIKEQLEKSEAALNDYRRKKGIIPGLMSLDGKNTVVLDRLTDLGKDLTKAQVERIGLESEVQLIKRHDYSSLPAVMRSGTIQQLSTELNNLYARSAALSSQFKPDYPPLAKLQAQIRAMQNRQAAEISNVVNSIETQYKESLEKEDELRAEMNRERDTTLSLNDSAAQYAILQRDVDTNHQLYNAVLTRMKDTAVAFDAQTSNTSVINTAEVPTSPTSPKKLRELLLAFLISVGLAGGIAFVLETLDNTLKDPEDVEHYLHVPNLGIVPEFSTAITGRSPYGLIIGREKSLPALAPGRELVTSYGSYSMVGESYRSLRTALMLSRAGSPPKVILITSALSHEGKTVTAVNTAVMLSQLGSMVLLIDADLRRPRCHRVLAVDNHLGLTEVLTGSAETHEMIRRTEIDNLDFLGTGSVPPNPTELVGSSKIEEIVGTLRDHYEYIVIDSSPVLPVTDSMLLAKVADGVVVVADGSATPRQQVRAACARLEYARAKIIGVVLNKVSYKRRGEYSYYYNQDYYGPADAEQAGNEPF